MQEFSQNPQDDAMPDVPEGHGKSHRSKLFTQNKESVLPEGWKTEDTLSFEYLTPSDAKAAFERLSEADKALIAADVDMVRAKLARGIKPRNPFEALLVEYALEKGVPDAPGNYPAERKIPSQMALHLKPKPDERVSQTEFEAALGAGKMDEGIEQIAKELAAGELVPVTTTGANPKLLSSGKSRSPGEQQSTGITRRLIEAFDKYAKKSPLLYRAIHGRRFLLPHHRQNDYPSQDVLNQNFSEQLHCIALGMFGYGDDVHNAQAGAMFTALHHGRPVLFMEREVGQKLLRTKMLSDLNTNDIRWRFPGVRIILPHGLLTIERDGQPQSAQYLDIAKIPALGIGLPPQFAREIEASIHMSPYAADPNRAPLSKLRVCMNQEFLVAVTAIDYSEFGFGPTIYAYTAPWENHTLGKLVTYEGNMNTALECDKSDETFLERIKLLTVNTLTFLSSIKFTYVSKVVRRLKMEGKHLKPELANALFVGQQQIRREVSPDYVPGPSTGLHLAAHMRWGHWRRKHAVDGWDKESNLIWIEPYMTHGYSPEQAK